MRTKQHFAATVPMSTKHHLGIAARFPQPYPAAFFAAKPSLAKLLDQHEDGHSHHHQVFC